MVMGSFTFNSLRQLHRSLVSQAGGTKKGLPHSSLAYGEVTFEALWSVISALKDQGRMPASTSHAPADHVGTRILHPRNSRPDQPTAPVEKSFEIVILV